MARTQQMDEFDSLDEFYSKTKNRHMQSGLDFDFDFTGTHDNDEAIMLATHGYNEHLDRIGELIDFHVSSLGVGRPDYYPDVHGDVLDIGRYTAGRPDCWLNEQEDDRLSADGKIKRICIGSSYMGQVTKEQYLNRGVVIMGVIDTLEHLGYRCEVDLVASSNGSSIKGDMQHFTKVRAKDADQPLNLEKMSFATMHASFFRRFVFSWRAAEWEFGSSGGGRTDDIVDCSYDGKKFTDEYDIVFGNDNSVTWSWYDTKESSKDRIIKRLREVGVEINED